VLDLRDYENVNLEFRLKLPFIVILNKSCAVHHLPFFKVLGFVTFTPSSYANRTNKSNSRAHLSVRLSVHLFSVGTYERIVTKYKVKDRDRKLLYICFPSIGYKNVASREHLRWERHYRRLRYPVDLVANKKYSNYL